MSAVCSRGRTHTKAYDFTNSAYQLTAIKHISSSQSTAGKNIYYGFSQQKNAKPNSFFQRIYMCFLIGTATLIMFK